MSSKSRKHLSSSRPARRPADPAAPVAETHEHVRVGGVDLPDEAIHVPKDRNPLFFVLMIALLIFLLIIFIVPGALLGAAGGGGGGPAAGVDDYLTFRVPTRDGGEQLVEVGQGEFVKRRLTIDKVLEFDPFLLLPIGIFGGRNSNLEEEDHARLVILDRLAEAAGVYVPAQDLRAHLTVLVRRNGLDPNSYKQYFAQGRDRMTTGEFEGELARMMRVRRFLTMVTEIPLLPDPDWIEETWHEQHVSERYQYTALPVADLEAEVREEGIDDEGLQAWFDGRDEFQKQPYRTEEERVVSFAHVDDVADFDAGALLAAYPPPEDADPAARAREYYDSVFLDRFLYDPGADEGAQDDTGDEGTEGDEASDDPAAEGDDGTSSDAAAGGDETSDDPAAEDDGADEGDGAATDQDEPATDQDEPAREFQTFEEVEAVAQAEAPIYFALEAWSEDLQDRLAAGEEVDLAAEAEAVGVPFTTTEPLTDSELRELERFGTGLVADTVWRTSEGSLASALFVTEDSFGLLRVDDVVEAEVPPVTEIRDEVFEEWVTAQAQERALERLRAIREGFERVEVDEDAEEPRVPLQDADGEEIPFRRADAEAFRAAVEAAGLTVEVRDWLDRRGKPAEDPDQDDPAHVFLRSSRAAQTAQAAEVGEVIPPALDSARATAYLVRKDGEREVPLAEMTPQDYASYKAQSLNSTPGEIRNALDFAYLQQHYDAVFSRPEGAGDERDRRSAPPSE